VKAIEPAANGHVLMHHAPIDREARLHGQRGHHAPLHHAPTDHVQMRHALIGRRAIVNEQRGPKANPRANETAMNRDGNLEKANVTIRTLVIAKPPATAKNRISGKPQPCTSGRLNLAPLVHFACVPVAAKTGETLTWDTSRILRR
jgi:hypothetical protein